LSKKKWEQEMWCLGVIQLIQHKYVGCEPWEGNERTIESVTYY
jgi:hypothetical protein